MMMVIGRLANDDEDSLMMIEDDIHMTLVEGHESMKA
jgi:hypothetical protein